MNMDDFMMREKLDVEGLKNSHKVLYNVLTSSFPHQLITSQIDYLYSPEQMIKSMLFGRARNIRFKPKKEKLYGPEFMNFVEYLHQMSKEKMKTIRTLETEILDVVGIPGMLSSALFHFHPFSGYMGIRPMTINIRHEKRRRCMSCG